MQHVPGTYDSSQLKPETGDSDTLSSELQAQYLRQGAKPKRRAQCSMHQATVPVVSTTEEVEAQVKTKSPKKGRQPVKAPFIPRFARLKLEREHQKSQQSDAGTSEGAVRKREAFEPEKKHVAKVKPSEPGTKPFIPRFARLEEEQQRLQSQQSDAGTSESAVRKREAFEPEKRRVSKIKPSGPSTKPFIPRFARLEQERQSVLHPRTDAETEEEKDTLKKHVGPEMQVPRYSLKILQHVQHEKDDADVSKDVVESGISGLSQQFEGLQVQGDEASGAVKVATGQVSTGLESVSVSKGSSVFNVTHFPKFGRGSKPKRLSGRKYRVLQEEYRLQLWDFTAMHLQHAHFIVREMFCLECGVVRLKKDLLSFINNRIENPEFCIFIFKVACLGHCMSVTNIIKFYHSLFYNEIDDQVLEECVQDIVIYAQDTKLSITKIAGVFSNSYTSYVSKNTVPHPPGFYRHVLRLLCNLVSARVSDPGCPVHVLDCVIVCAAQLLGTIYNNYKSFAKMQGVSIDNMNFFSVVEDMGSTRNCCGQLGLVCYGLLNSITYMYNVNDNGVKNVGGLAMPKVVVERGSEHFHGVVERNIASGSMGYHVIMGDCAARVCAVVDKYNVMACEDEIAGYENIYNQVMPSSKEEKGPQR
ncbi:hypothetical protein ECHHL_0964 [Ehrlichia chaffeensis str. Heartland]|uniref:DUF3514 domain-containing protein n=1 Tax=Ehrlichia chaffeensis TaxID=945 RepID=UPI000444DEE2|nr:DUF3514 domain-containing protein [Ehrlichia chaffeensis]AHX04093.1 hypothetical protein ECHHL_0964 [Ehrlichia chaffeensis str. Heartland]AHX10217.1 hypothetical protein ECHWP_0959 [Ehrlichia chaffeensis str. West Paces]